MGKGQSDALAQRLWKGVASASDAISDLVSDIPYATVRGEESCRELREAQALLGQVASLLARTGERESARYAEVTP